MRKLKTSFSLVLLLPGLPSLSMCLFVKWFLYLYSCHCQECSKTKTGQAVEDFVYLSCVRMKLDCTCPSGLDTSFRSVKVTRKHNYSSVFHLELWVETFYIRKTPVLNDAVKMLHFVSQGPVYLRMLSKSGVLGRDYITVTSRSQGYGVNRSFATQTEQALKNDTTDWDAIFRMKQGFWNRSC